MASSSSTANPSASSPAKCTMPAFPAHTGATVCAWPKPWASTPSPPTSSGTAHEPRPGVYDFSGNHDVAEFVREAQQEGLYVILRPGPYSCAEWEFGGFPAWLLKDPTMVVRSRRPEVPRRRSRAGSSRLGKELAPLQIGNGGPIIAVQVENEYGSYGDDHEYMEDIHHDPHRRWLHPMRSSTPPTAQTNSRDGSSARARPPSSTSAPAKRSSSFATLKEAPPRRPLHERRILGRLVRSLGRAPRPHRRPATSQRPRLDPPPGLLHQHLHVSRRHQLWLDERRQLQRQKLRARRHQLRLRRRPRRIRPSHAQILPLPRRHRARHRHHAASRPIRAVTHRHPRVHHGPRRIALGQPASAGSLRTASHHGSDGPVLRLRPLPHADRTAPSAAI